MHHERKHRAHEIMRRKHLADGGAVDEEAQRRAQEHGQTALNHIEARGSNAILRRETGIDRYEGRTSSDADLGDQDIANYRDTFGDKAADDLAQRGRELREQRSHGGRVHRAEGGRATLADGNRARLAATADTFKGTDYGAALGDLASRGARAIGRGVQAAGDYLSGRSDMDRAPGEAEADYLARRRALSTEGR